MFKKIMATALVVGSTFSAHAAMDEAVNSLVESRINGWLKNETVLNAIKAQNAAHASLAQDQIDALDEQWRAEVKGDGSELVSKVLGNDLSSYLKGVYQEGEGLYSEIFVMDNKGLNVGQSHATSDYWQGDEAKWQKTFNQGMDAVLIGEVEFDESSQTYQVQVSLPVYDADGTALGAVTIGLDADRLMEVE